MNIDNIRFPSQDALGFGYGCGPVCLTYIHRILNHINDSEIKATVSALVDANGGKQKTLFDELVSLAEVEINGNSISTEVIRHPFRYKKQQMPINRLVIVPVWHNQTEDSYGAARHWTIVIKREDGTLAAIDPWVDESYTELDEIEFESRYIRIPGADFYKSAIVINHE